MARSAALKPSLKPSLKAAAGGKLPGAREPTAFERSVYAEATKVPKGSVTTYAAIAKALGTSPRAVGGALKRNPFAPAVPCHRVVASTRELGGFFGSVGPESVEVKRKKQMLLDEGVAFESDNVVAKECIV